MSGSSPPELAPLPPRCARRIAESDLRGDECGDGVSVSLATERRCRKMRHGRTELAARGERRTDDVSHSHSPQGLGEAAKRRLPDERGVGEHHDADDEVDERDDLAMHGEHGAGHA